MNDEELNNLLFTTFTSKQLILNFMKTFSLLGAAKCLNVTDENSSFNSKIANDIMNDIIEGYQLENHSIQ